MISFDLGYLYSSATNLYNSWTSYVRRYHTRRHNAQPISADELRRLKDQMSGSSAVRTYLKASSGGLVPPTSGRYASSGVRFR